MDALPGTPQIQNSIPMKFFNTDLYAAPIFGTCGALLVFFGGMFYLESRRKKLQAAGEGYGDREEKIVEGHKSLPHPLVAALPLLSVLLVTLLLQKVIFPHWDIAPWATQAPYKMDPNSLTGSMNNWALIIALAIGTALAFLLNLKRMAGNYASTISLGTTGALLAVMNTASEVGFGNVVKSLDGFRGIANSMMNIRFGGGPLLSEAVTVNVLSGVTGSASGGMSIALDAFGKEYLAWANRTNTSPELLHRVAAMASGGMDTLPHNGAVITLLAITGLTHRQSYRDIFAITLIKTSAVFFLIAITALLH
jgi:H+/gluconate symporter-like permease